MAYVFALICIGIAAYAGRTLLNATRSRSWPSVEGVVTRSSIVKRGGQRSTSGFSPFLELSYRYEVEGRQLEGSRVDFGDLGKEKRPQELERRYPVGTRVTVFYDPAAHGMSTLTRGVPRELFGLLAIGGLFALLSVSLVVGIFLSLIRPPRGSTPPAGIPRATRHQTSKAA